MVMVLMAVAVVAVAIPVSILRTDPVKKLGIRS